MRGVQYTADSPEASAELVDLGTHPVAPKRPLMADMPVIVRHQDRGALRLDHRHDQALCRGRRSDLVLITGIMPPTGGAVETGAILPANSG
jgi:hypothetical protein